MRCDENRELNKLTIQTTHVTANTCSGEVFVLNSGRIDSVKTTTGIKIIRAVTQAADDINIACPITRRGRNPEGEPITFNIAKSLLRSIMFIVRSRLNTIVRTTVPRTAIINRNGRKHVSISLILLSK